MSERLKIKWQLNIAVLLIELACVSVFVSTAIAQVEYLTPEAMKTVASMPSTSLLACVTILSLILCGYLIKLLFGKLLTALDNNTRACSDMAKLLAERPCVRNPKND
jgi:uncharacterized membrane protein